MRNMKLTHFSLFSGIGGIDLAAEWAGFQTVGQCEMNEYARKILQKNFGDIPRWRDIKDVTKESFLGKCGECQLTLLSGGFPCQPYSVAGKRKGEEDDRNLWPEMFRVVQELRPTWVIGENVAGFINMALDRVISDLESADYQCRAFVLPACGVGALHKRDRVFIVAHTKGYDASGASREFCETNGRSWRSLCGESGDAGEQPQLATKDVIPNANNSPTPRQREHSREVLPYTEPKRSDMGRKFLAHSKSIRCGSRGLPLGTEQKKSVSGKHGASL